jgi:hypothetical protein
VLKYNGTKFAPSTGASVTISDTAPTSPTPQAGDQWYESDTGRTFIYYDSVWVEIGNATDIAGALQPGQVTALSAVTSLTTDDVFPVIDNPSSATAANKITYGNLVTAMSASLAPGLVLVKTQAIGSGVTSVTVTDAFSSTYDNYSITVSGGVGTGSEYLYVQLGSATSNYRFSYVYGNLGSTVNTAGTVAGSSFQYVGWANTSMLSAEIFIGNPFATKMTTCRAFAGKSGNEAGMFSGVQIDSTSFTSFVLGVGAGTMTGGTIRVYGYRNS